MSEWLSLKIDNAMKLIIPLVKKKCKKKNVKLEKSKKKTI